MRHWTLLLASTAFLALPAAAEIFRQPEVIRWGASTAQLQQQLAPLCPKLLTRRIDPPFLPDVKTQQLQIDCGGFQFRGRGRHVEFVIRDDRLVMVWLMVEATESAAIIADMTSALGPPTGNNSHYIAFEKQRTAWRHKPAEILFYAPELDADMKPDFR
jgi:hypothetical protein